MRSTSALSHPELNQIRAEEPAPDLISIPETARRIGLHADTLYRLCRTGQFSPAIHIGGIRFDTASGVIGDDAQRPDQGNCGLRRSPTTPFGVSYRTIVRTNHDREPQL